jgi:hypothetical protein
MCLYLKDKNNKKFMRPQFVTVGHSHPSLIFECKARTLPFGCTSRLSRLQPCEHQTRAKVSVIDKCSSLLHYSLKVGSDLLSKQDL